MGAIMRQIWIAVALAMALAQPVKAAVVSVDIVERTPFAGGTAFGSVGPYEKIRGVAHIALDPDATANARIVDLKLAPRDAQGRVTFDSPFILLRPVQAPAATLIYDVNNRGHIAMLGQIDGRSPAHNDPSTVQDAGDGFLMRHGYAMLFSAWTWDVAPPAPGDKPLVLAPPVARHPDGSPIVGRVENEFTVLKPTDATTYAGMVGLTYEPMTPDDPKAVLTARARPDDPRTPVPRSRWHFLPPEQPSGPGRVQLDGGFQPGTLYELTYRTRDPKVTGAGLAGIRDLLSWFRGHPLAGMAPPRHILIFGISQSGRLIGRMLHDGLDVDEEGRLAFDGAYMQVPGGGGSAGFNSRFVQPTRHPSMLEEHDYPADAFPFTSSPSRDPVTGRTASTLDRAADAHGNLPKLFIANTSTEFWNRDASLVATTADGASDVTPAPNVRLYAFMGAQHYVGRSHTRFPYVNCVSTTDHYLPMRALIVALDKWVSLGTPPPDNAYPHVADGTLLTVTAYRAAFPKGIGITPPMDNLHEDRLDFGRRFAREGIADIVPPIHGASYGTRVPAPDVDGNDRSGVRLVELEVPLGTHTGWNERDPKAGFPWATARFDGSFVPFARTEAERKAAGDPRPSLAARYPTRNDYIARVRAAAAHEVAAGFLLPEDVERTVAENVWLYDRIMAHEPSDATCNYLFAP